MTYTDATAHDACGICGADYADRGYPWHKPGEDCLPLRAPALEDDR